jgi:hypothetical protein
MAITGQRKHAPEEALNLVNNVAGTIEAISQKLWDLAEISLVEKDMDNCAPLYT